MVVQKLSISLSQELEEALRSIASQRKEDLSPLIETLLREHWLAAIEIQRGRERMVGSKAVREDEVERLLDLARKSSPFDASRKPGS